MMKIKICKYVDMSIYNKEKSKLEYACMQALIHIIEMIKIKICMYEGIACIMMIKMKICGHEYGQQT